MCAGRVPKRMCWLPPDYYVAVLAKRPPGAKPVSSSHENRELWRFVGCDMTEWTRKVHLWICVDEASKFRVGHVWAEGQKVGNIDGSRVLELLQERWISVFGRMHTLRTEPEGAWRNREVHERLIDMRLVLDLHPGEASWQASVTETTNAKETMTRIALERPDLKFTEVLAAAVLAHNEMERVRGFSPAQWARGFSQNWTQPRCLSLLKWAPVWQGIIRVRPGRWVGSLRHMQMTTMIAHV